jgi:hypothetical protein
VYGVFVRILQGRVADPAGVRAELDRWRREVAPEVAGWQRLTAGVTEDRELVALFRYAGRATAGTGLPAQAAWERAIGRHLTGPATWHDCTQVHAMKGGDADDAGFVQVVQGRVADPVRLAAARVEVERTLREHAPHVLGVLVAEHADEPGRFTEVSYVTSEAEARAAERAMPVDVAVVLGTVRSYVEGLRFTELREPILARPAVMVV